jgi:hypothetical protein
LKFILSYAISPLHPSSRGKGETNRIDFVLQKLSLPAALSSAAAWALRVERVGERNQRLVGETFAG